MAGTRHCSECGAEHPSDTLSGGLCPRCLLKLGFRPDSPTESETNLASNIPEQIGPYRIVELLGRGGMGEVYLVEDTTLDRKVALKFLPQDLQADEMARARFLREAKSAAALDHPYICHIHEIGEAEGFDFITMEYLEGETLRERLAEGRLALRDALQTAGEIAEALEKAHQNGIVHRDLKPSNIMLTPEGHAKVMDFGLAKKLIPEAGVDRQEPTLTGLTKEGTTVGTPGYMSPEQTKGEALDHRSDIFAFGILLYEMLTGRNPFRRESVAETIGAILHCDPPPLAKYAADVPELMEHTVRKMLAKGPDRRYQAVHEVSTNLGEVLETIGPPARIRRKHWKRWALIASSLGLVSVAVALFYLGFFSGATLPPMKTIPFTTYPGREQSPAISPDGKQIAFSWNGESGDNFDIYVSLIGQGSPLRLTTHPGSDDHPVWSPDGREIAFTRRHQGRGEIYIIPALGGLEKRVVTEVTAERGLDWSPDGQLLAYLRTPAEEPESIHLVSLGDPESRRLTFPPSETRGDFTPKFSPDGKLLAFTRLARRAVEDLHVVPVAGGKPRRLTFDNKVTGDHEWSPDGKEILFSSTRGGSLRLWRIPFKGGEPQLMQVGAEDVLRFSISRVTPLLAYQKWIVDINIWRTPGPESPDPCAAPTKLIALTHKTPNASYSPDGNRMAFSAEYSGSGTAEIWIANGDGSGRFQLTSLEQYSTRPSWSPDGRQIAFVSRPGEHSEIYVINIEEPSPRRLTSGAAQKEWPSWSRDGKWIYYCSNRSGTWQIWRIPAEGGEPKQITKEGGYRALESADGRLLYHSKPGQAGIWQVPVAGGEEVQILAERLTGWVLWKENIVVATGRNLELFDPVTRRLEPICDVRHSVSSVSPDGKWILYSRIDQIIEDIVLVENFR